MAIHYILKEINRRSDSVTNDMRQGSPQQQQKQFFALEFPMLATTSRGKFQVTIKPTIYCTEVLFMHQMGRYRIISRQFISSMKIYLFHVRRAPYTAVERVL